MNRLACASWSFPACTLEEIAGITRVLGLQAIDVGFFYRSALDRDALLSSPASAAEDLKALQIEVNNLYYLFGSTPEERNLAHPESLSENISDFEKAARFSEEANISSIMVLPGIVNFGQSRAQALEQSAKALRELVPIAEDAGVTLTVEPHVHSYLESPQLVFELLERVPGLKLTLDYAHFVCLGYRQEEIDPLAPHATHVHLRQARPGVLQAKLSQGTINFPALLSTLKDSGYDGSLTFEYVHQDYMDTLYDDVLTETVQLRDLVRSCL